jgi:methionine-rich copper-binding protein CopC
LPAVKIRQLIYATLCILLPASASAHVRLVGTVPANGDTVRSPLSEIHLRFSEGVDAHYTIVQLLDATGHELTFGTLVPVGAAPSEEYILKLARPLMAGQFTVRWKTVSDDGHATNGTFDFIVDVPGAVNNPAPPPTTAAATHAAQNNSTEIAPMFRPESSNFWILARWMKFDAHMQ